MNTYALTAVTYRRRAILLRTSNADLLLETLFHYRDQGRFLLHGFAIMPEHIHLLLTPTENQTVERCAQCIKGGFSHRRRAAIPGNIWQPGFHEHRIRDAEDFHGQLVYIAANPERRHLQNYTYVHTNSPDRMDAWIPTQSSLRVK